MSDLERCPLVQVSLYYEEGSCGKNFTDLPTQDFFFTCYRKQRFFLRITSAKKSKFKIQNLKNAFALKYILNLLNSLYKFPAL